MKYMTVLYLIVSLILYSACTENRNSNNNIKQNQVKLTNLTDTLKFKTGIRSILQDSKGNYWFGSDQEGVCKYDGKTFTYFTTENGFCGKQVIYIKEDETGLIWFGTSSGLCCFNGNKFTADRNDFPTNILGDKQHAAWSLNRTDLWFPGKNQNELIRIDKGKIHTIKYPTQIPSKGNPVDYGITGFSKSKNGGLWIAHYSGVSYYDGKTFQFINDSTMHYDGESKYMHVRSILEDSKGRLWIGNNGIGVQLKEKDSIIHFSEKHNLFKGEIFSVKSPEGTLMHVFAIKEDSKGNIWFGDRDTGAWRFDGIEIKNFMLDSTLKTQHIWDIYDDRYGNLLFASGDKGVYKFNGNGFDRVF
jgi:ligand-binding sensor domain-containing protein